MLLRNWEDGAERPNTSVGEASYLLNRSDQLTDDSRLRLCGLRLCSHLPSCVVCVCVVCAFVCLRILCVCVCVCVCGLCVTL